MTGHLLGGAGGLEAGITIMAIRDQIAPPTINYECPDPECDLDYVPNHARPMKIDYALSNSFGFGGTNGCLIFKTDWDENRGRDQAGSPPRLSSARERRRNLDRRRQPGLRDQRARRLRPRRSPAIAREARRRSDRDQRRSGARLANHSRSPRQGRRPRDTRGIDPSARHARRRALACNSAASRIPRPHPHRPAVRRSRIRANRRGPGRTARSAELDHHHASPNLNDAQPAKSA